MNSESSYRDVFGDVLADHHEAPRNFGIADSPSVSEKGYNPLCGDRVELTIKLSDPKDTNGQATITLLDQCRFQGEGCSICMASTSIMTEKVQGQTLDQALNWIEAFRCKMLGQESAFQLPSEDSGDDLAALYGVRRFSVRIKCALLPWTTLKLAIQKIQNSETPRPEQS
jgi:nitrogen fixation NifU-like protein